MFISTVHIVMFILILIMRVCHLILKDYLLTYLLTYSTKHCSVDVWRSIVYHVHPANFV